MTVLDSLSISSPKKKLVQIVWWSTLEKKNTSGQTYARHNFYRNNIIVKEKSYDQYTYSLHAHLTCEDVEKEISVFNIQVKAF